MSLFGSQMQIPQVALDAYNSVSTAASGLGQKALNILDPSGVRLAAAKLMPGGTKAGKTASTPTAKFANEVKDWRVKVSLSNAADYFYEAGSSKEDRGLLDPLWITGGVIFPYTPTISVTHTARYGAQQLTHSNYTNYAYEGSEVQAITIAGDFTAQTQVEAAYVLACIHFFRTATKMWFGGNGGSHVGNPPPIVFLNGYGAAYFPNVPCVITSFQHTMPPDVDYIPATSNIASSTTAQTSAKQETINRATSTMIPTSSQISITLQPIYSRRNIYDNFSLDKFAKGELLGSKKDSKGGFI